MVAATILLGIRGLQAFLALVVLGLSAHLVDKYTSAWQGWSPESVGFMLFTSIWTLIAVAYLALTPIFLPRAAHIYAIGAIDFITMILWFAAFVAVACLWRETWPDTPYSYYSSAHSTIYGNGVAAIIFGALLWLTFIATTVLSALRLRRTSRRDSSPSPEMTGA